VRAPRTAKRVIVLDRDGKPIDLKQGGFDHFV
jgi:hypothetical protein